MAITDNAVHALLIDGEEIATARTRTVIDPATGEPLAEVADATAADAERAVAAARAAFRRGDWSRITPGERAAVIDRLAHLLEERADGPVLSVQSFQNDNEAFALANDTR